jgi:transposase
LVRSGWAIRDAEVKTLDRQLQQLVTQAAPITSARVAVSTGHADTLLATAGQNIERLRHEASFAALCGASPIPVSTGRTDATASTTAATATPTARCT